MGRDDDICGFDYGDEGMIKSDYYMRNVQRIEIDSSFLGCYLILDCGHHTFHPDIKSIYMEQFCIDCFNENYFKHHQQS